MGEGFKMVHLRTVPDAWHAKVLAARLGSEGILTHLSGPVSGPYPFGAVSVHVEAGQAELAAELLLADEVESAFAQHEVALGAGTYGFDDILPSSGRRTEHRYDEPQVVLGPDDALDLTVLEAWGQDDEAEPHPKHRPISRRRRVLAAFAALVVAGTPLLAHFTGQ